MIFWFFLKIIIGIEIEWWPPSQWSRLRSFACFCQSRGMIYLLLIFFCDLYSLLSYFNWIYVFNFLPFLVWSNGPRSYRNLTSCIWTLVHWETRSNNSSLYTIQSRFLSVTLSTILVQYSFSWPFINLCQELLLWYFCRLLCLIRDLKKILWLTFRSIWKILLTQGLGSGWFPLSRFEPIWCSLLHYAL